MAQTEAGKSKTAITNKRKYGEDYYRKIGSSGGRAIHEKPRGFAAMSRERLEEISKKGHEAQVKKKLME